MIAAKLPVQEAVVSRLQGALTEEVRSDADVIPSVEVGEDDELWISESTTTEHSDVTATIYARAYTQVKAKQIAETVIAELTDRTDVITLTGSFYVLYARLTGSDMQTIRRVDGPTIYENVIRITFRVHR